MFSKIECSKVYVSNSKINPDFDGAIAKQNITKDEVIEIGIVRIVDIDGNNNPYLFTWSDNIPNENGQLFDVLLIILFSSKQNNS